MVVTGFFVLWWEVNSYRSYHSRLHTSIQCANYEDLIRFPLYKNTLLANIRCFSNHAITEFAGQTILANTIKLQPMAPTTMQKFTITDIMARYVTNMFKHLKGRWYGKPHQEHQDISAGERQMVWETLPGYICWWKADGMGNLTRISLLVNCRWHWKSHAPRCL